MYTPIGRSVMAFAAASLLSACSAVVTSPAMQVRSDSEPAASSALVAFSPADPPLVATYNLPAHGSAKPEALLKGAHTTLSYGNGMAVGSDGTLYVVNGSPLRLDVFAPGATGDQGPERSVRLPSTLLPGDAVGLALDGKGNFWIADEASNALRRFSLSAVGEVKPNLSIVVSMATPAGLLKAEPKAVAVDAQGHVYCACFILLHGATASGATEYMIPEHGKPSIVRAFYNLQIPASGVREMAIDGNGTIYEAAQGEVSATVYIFNASNAGGQVQVSRRLTNACLTNVSSLAVDAQHNLYVALPAGIAVFGPRANGGSAPERWIRDPADLHYGGDQYGTLLGVRP